MEDQNAEISKTLLEIRDTLNKLFLCFEDDYFEIQKRKSKLVDLNKILSKPRKIIFPLLFDAKHLSQAEIARLSGVSPQAVNQFIDQLLSLNIINQSKDENNIQFFIDKHNLLNYLQNE